MLIQSKYVEEIFVKSYVIINIKYLFFLNADVKNSPHTVKKTCEVYKGNIKDCLIQNTRSNMKELFKFVETHRINDSSNLYMEQIKAKQRLIFYLSLF